MHYPIIIGTVAAQSEIECNYNVETKQAEWSPDISNYHCLGTTACKADDTNAEFLRTEYGADVRTCSTVQDGGRCTDYDCQGYDSYVRHVNGTIQCKYGMWETEASEYCTFCPDGEHKVNITSCEVCEDGKYLRSEEDKHLTECQNCTEGRYFFNKTMGCVECKAGEYQDVEGQTSCELCPAGTFSPDDGGSTCQNCFEGMYQNTNGSVNCTTCPIWHSCPAGSVTPVFQTGYVVGVVAAVLALTVIIAFVVKFILLYTKVRTMWEPQSEEDALLAKEFILPKTSKEMRPSVKAFNICLKHFVENEGWSDEQQATILEHRDIVVEYLGQRIHAVGDPEKQNIMRCCLEMDALHDFKTLYDATMMNIRNKETEGFKTYSAIVPKLQAKCNVCPPNASDLMKLYQTGRVAYPLFHAFIAKAARASHTAYLFKSHGKQPSMKGLYRVLEKGVLKYNDNIEAELNFGNVRDLVRGGIIDLTLAGLAKVAEYFLHSEEVTLCRIKDRFNEPSPAGWTDMMINFYLNHDPDKHVCEVQLIHFKMLSQRTTQEGHGAYNIYRVCAKCLLYVWPKRALYAFVVLTCFSMGPCIVTHCHAVSYPKIQETCCYPIPHPPS